MKWSIPAKTFFVGEYVAMAGAPAIVLTTEPCFELTLTEQSGLEGIHPDSPAGLFWAQQMPAHMGLHWHDPYHGIGGMGASSAQWLGAYYAYLHIQQKNLSQDDMLSTYFEYAWNGLGMRPSGYDVLAQSQQGCVYINQQHTECHAYAWPFDELAFILLHTGQKVATHHHLQAFKQPIEMETLIAICDLAHQSFERADHEGVIHSVNAYYQCLLQMNLVAAHTIEYIKWLQQNPDILAMKGCGALGADVILLLVLKNKLASTNLYLKAAGLNILATSENLYINLKKNVNNT